MTTKQQQRERAERRRKLEEFWRWVIGERPDCFSDQLNALPGLCMNAVFIVESELIARQRECSHELHRDLSLAQLEVLEMLEERVGERREEQQEKDWRCRDVRSWGWKSGSCQLGREEPVVDNTRFFNRLGEISQRIESGEDPDCAAGSYFEAGSLIAYDPRKDPFFHPEVAAFDAHNIQQSPTDAEIAGSIRRATEHAVSVMGLGRHPWEFKS